MMLSRRLAALAGIGLLAATPFDLAAAQGVTTGAIGGLVTDSTGNPIGQVQIQIVQRQTGYTAGGLTRENGRFLIPALEAGGPYSVTARRIGFQPHTRDNVFVSLSQTTQVDFRLGQQVAQLAGVTVVATTSDFSSSRQGVETTLSDSMLQRIPTLSRDLVDFVKISPQVVRPLDGGPSAGGTYNRFNNFTIDGASQNDRFGLGSVDGSSGATCIRARGLAPHVRARRSGPALRGSRTSHVDLAEVLVQRLTARTSRTTTSLRQVRITDRRKTSPPAPGLRSSTQLLAR